MAKQDLFHQNLNVLCQKIQFGRYFINVMPFFFVTFSKSLQLSVKLNCFWELCSLVPPQYPALAIIATVGRITELGAADYQH